MPQNELSAAVISRQADRDARMREHAADLYDALKLATGVLCESGDMNNYRNLSDVELGRMWIDTAKHAGHLMNLIDGLPNEFQPLSRHLSFPANVASGKDTGGVTDGK